MGGHPCRRVDTKFEVCFCEQDEEHSGPPTGSAAARQPVGDKPPLLFYFSASFPPVFPHWYALSFLPSPHLPLPMMFCPFLSTSSCTCCCGGSTSFLLFNCALLPVALRALLCYCPTRKMVTAFRCRASDREVGLVIEDGGVDKLVAALAGA